MPFIYEVNGQRVEFDKEPTEQDIDEAAKQLGSQPANQKQGFTGIEAAGPAVTGYGYQITPTVTPATNLQGPVKPGEVAGKVSYELKPSGYNMEAMKKIGRAHV